MSVTLDQVLTELTKPSSGDMLFYSASKTDGPQSSNLEQGSPAPSGCDISITELYERGQSNGLDRLDVRADTVSQGYRVRALKSF